MTASLCGASIGERELRSIEEHRMFMRDCTFLPSQNHGHGAAKAARPMAALPHPCTNFAAASVHGAKCFRSDELKEHRIRQRVVRFSSDLDWLQARSRAV